MIVIKFTNPISEVLTQINFNFLSRVLFTLIWGVSPGVFLDIGRILCLAWWRIHSQFMWADLSYLVTRRYRIRIQLLCEIYFTQVAVIRRWLFLSGVIRSHLLCGMIKELSHKIQSQSTVNSIWRKKNQDSTVCSIYTLTALKRGVKKYQHTRKYHLITFHMGPQEPLRNWSISLKFSIKWNPPLGNPPV